MVLDTIQNSFLNLNRNMRLLILCLSTYFFVGCSNESQKIEEKFDGTYDLVEWSQNNNTFQSPEVSGRLIFDNGNFLVTIHKRFDPKKYFTYVGYGDYKVENNKFAYRYVNSMTLNGDESHQYIGDTTTAFGGGNYRWYTYELKNEGLFMFTEDGKQQWNFLNSGEMKYTDLTDLSGVPMTRTWKKVP